MIQDLIRYLKHEGFCYYGIPYLPKAEKFAKIKVTFVMFACFFFLH